MNDDAKSNFSFKNVKSKDGYENAMEWYLKAIEENVEQNEYAQMALYYIGNLHEKGLGVPKSSAVAKKWYQKAAGYGVSDAKAALERLNSEDEKSKKIFQDVLKLAEQGDKIAQFDLGFMYQIGQNIEIDINKSIYWYRKSVEQNVLIAMQFLADLYFDIEEYSKAMDLYHKIDLIHGNPDGYDALDNIGYLYEHGYGVQKNLSKAMEYYLKSLNKDPKLSNALSKVINIYLNGLCESKFINDAEKWYEHSKELEKTFQKAEQDELKVTKINLKHNDPSSSAKKGSIPEGSDKTKIYSEKNITDNPENNTKDNEQVYTQQLLPRWVPASILISFFDALLNVLIYFAAFFLFVLLITLLITITSG